MPLLGAVLWGAGPVVAQDPTGPLCLLTADEMAELVGAPIVRVDAVERECAYTADPAERSIQVVLRLVPPHLSGFNPGDDPLWPHERAHPAGGQEAVIADRRAWAADDGTWVEVGQDVLAVWANTSFDADPPPMPDTGLAIAAMAVPRYLTDPGATPSDTAGITARFPAAVGDEPLDVESRTLDELYALLATTGPGARDRLPDLRDAIAGLGIAEDALEIAQAEVWDLRAGYLDIVAIGTPGTAAGSLLEPVLRIIAGDESSPAQPRTMAGREVMSIAPADGDEESTRWLTVDGDVLWLLTGPEPLVQALLEALAEMAA